MKGIMFEFICLFIGLATIVFGFQSLNSIIIICGISLFVLNGSYILYEYIDKRDKKNLDSKQN